MATELVHTSVADAIAESTLDRGPVNALSMPLIDALLAALQKARDDSAGLNAFVEKRPANYRGR